MTNKTNQGRETPFCPFCNRQLLPVKFPGGYLSRDQWESVRAGDWYCDSTSCLVEGQCRYFWDRDFPQQPPQEPEGKDDIWPLFHEMWGDAKAQTTYFKAKWTDLQCGIQKQQARIEELEQKLQKSVKESKLYLDGLGSAEKDVVQLKQKLADAVKALGPFDISLDVEFPDSAVLHVADEERFLKVGITVGAVRNAQSALKSLKGMR